MSEATRAWIYRILLAIAAAAVVLGFVTEDQVAAIVGIATALLGNGLATANTSTRRK